MKRIKRENQKFRWKFTKAMLRRPMENIPTVTVFPQQDRPWRGTILAILTILLISGMIVLAALFFTSWEQKISYQRFTIDELVWFSRMAKNPLYFWTEDCFLFSHPNGSWQQLNLTLRRPGTFSDTLELAYLIPLNTNGLQEISNIWSNLEQTAWLIEHSASSFRLQEKVHKYTVIIRSSGLPIAVHLNEGQEAASLLHFARWAGNKEFSLFVQKGTNLYYINNIAAKSDSDIRCLTCPLPKGWTYAYPGWIYRYYFNYGQVGVFWKRGGSELIMLATNEEHLKKLPVARYHEHLMSAEKAVHSPYQPITEQLRVPFVEIIVMDFSGNTKLVLNWTTLSALIVQIPNESNSAKENSNFILTHVEWFNDTSFLIAGVIDTQRCGFILLCSFVRNASEDACQHVWYQCIWSGWLNMLSSPGKLFGASNGVDQLITKLPYTTNLEGTAYQVAILWIQYGLRNQITWLTTHPIQVLDLLLVDNSSVFFTGTIQQATKHLFRLDRLSNQTIWCLTCAELHENMTSLLPTFDLYMQRTIPIEKANVTGQLLQDVSSNATFRSIRRIGMSTNGQCFAIEWSTGTELFGATGVQEAPTRLIINQLTRVDHEASEYAESIFEKNARFDPDSGVSLWCQTSAHNVTLVWHSHLLFANQSIMRNPAVSTDEHITQNSANSLRAARSIMPDEARVTAPKSPKQHLISSPPSNMKLKAKFFSASQSPLHTPYPTPSFGDRPLPNVVLRLVNLSTSKRRAVSPSEVPVSNPTSSIDLIHDGALVRFWFPPYLNERHLQRYPLVINVVSVNKMFPVGQQQLLDELAIILSASFDIITMRVESWIGEAQLRVNKEEIVGELANYRLLLKSLRENYHYIGRDKTGLVGAHGIHAHLAAQLLREERMALNLTCAALLTPIVSWSYQGFPEAARLFDSTELYKYLEFDLTRQAHMYRKKAILLLYGTADTVVPYKSMTKLVRAFSENAVQFSMLPLFDADHEFAQSFELKETLLTRLSVFLYDCLRKNAVERDVIHRRLHMEENEQKISQQL